MYVPINQQIYQTAINYVKCPKIDQMAIKYTNHFNCKTLIFFFFGLNIYHLATLTGIFWLYLQVKILTDNTGRIFLPKDRTRNVDIKSESTTAAAATTAAATTAAAATAAAATTAKWFLSL
jgi:hypothetical protein